MGIGWSATDDEKNELAVLREERPYMNAPIEELLEIESRGTGPLATLTLWATPIYRTKHRRDDKLQKALDATMGKYLAATGAAAENWTACDDEDKAAYISAFVAGTGWLPEMDAVLQFPEPLSVLTLRKEFVDRCALAERALKSSCFHASRYTGCRTYPRFSEPVALNCRHGSDRSRTLSICRRPTD